MLLGLACCCSHDVVCFAVMLVSTRSEVSRLRKHHFNALCLVLVGRVRYQVCMLYAPQCVLKVARPLEPSCAV